MVNKNGLNVGTEVAIGLSSGASLSVSESWHQDLLADSDPVGGHSTKFASTRTLAADKSQFPGRAGRTIVNLHCFGKKSEENKVALA